MREINNGQVELSVPWKASASMRPPISEPLGAVPEDMDKESPGGFCPELRRESRNRADCTRSVSQPAGKRRHRVMPRVFSDSQYSAP